MNISENDIKGICSSGVYKSGISYFKEGRVHIKTRSAEKIVASVDSDRVYSVHAAFSHDGKISDTFCTCPYYQTMNTNCKHIIATLKARQAELSQGFDDTLGEDGEASLLCRKFEAITDVKKQLPVRFAFYATASCTESPIYSMSLSFGDADTPANFIEDFLDAYISGKEYKLSKHKVYKNSTHEIGGFEEHIISLLAESYQNKSSANENYRKKNTQTDFGALTAKRILPLLSGTGSRFFINGIPYPNLMIKSEDPDILIDITATDDNINISIPQRGIALIPDGSWFFFDGDIYQTTDAWRSWFMPIYSALAQKNRTQIDFRGSNSIAFATNILPQLRGKKGVIMQGLENVIVDDKPKFDIYFDRYADGITAAITAKYGNILIRLPEDMVVGDKIIVRDIPDEKHVLSFFGEFSKSGQSLYLDGDSELFSFFTEALPRLSNIATLHTSESFDSMILKAPPKILETISYNEKIDLLEVGFESDLTASEITAILSAIRHKKPFYRTKTGEFLSLLEELEGFSLLSNLNFSYSDIKEGKKSLSKYHVLYLMSAMDSENVTADSGFLKLTQEIKNIRADIPEELSGTLRDYQKTGVHWMKQISELGFGGILADDMGLGKTLQAITFIMSENHTLPSLIIAPSSLIYNWYAEIEKFVPTARVKIIDGTKEDRIKALENISGYDFIITSYPLLRRDIAEFMPLCFAYCIIDEAQYIKNAKTALTKAVKKIRAEKYFALSGTPMENSLSELWSLFDFIMPGYLGSHQLFSEQFEAPILHGDNAVADALRAKIKPFILRRMKYDVLSELPDKIETTYFAELLPKQKKLYSALLSQAKRETDGFSEGNQMQILALLMRLRQICCHPKLIDADFDGESGKLELLEELVSSAVNAGHRLLIFSGFSSMLAIIKKRLQALGIDSFLLDGSTPAIARTQMADSFNAGHGHVFLVSLKAGGTGLNLIGADMVIHFDPWWNPAVAAQATDRAYRIGQTKAVHVINLASKGTIEEQILKLQQKKKNLTDDIIKVNKKALSSLTKEEILELFK